METLLPFELAKEKRKIIVKKRVATDPTYGCKPEQRTTQELINNSVICINKPAGPTSHEVTDYVRKILETEKAGHGGTLDPNVTGVLPIALGKATRIVQTLLPAGKEYICLMHLHKQIPQSKIHQTANSLVGKITQLPPLRSAVKRQERERELYYFKILEIKNQDVLFQVGCQAGTYIRRLCIQMGDKLKTGAHMSQLVRTKAGPFNNKEIYSLHDLKDAYELYKQGNDTELKKIIKPIEFAIQHLPKIWATDKTVDTLCHGANLSIPGIAKLESDIKENDLVAILTLKDELICIGEALLTPDAIMEKQKGLAVRTTKVFMAQDIYPHFKKTNQ